MGHSTMSTTQRYIADNFEYQQAAIERLGDQFNTLIEAINGTKVVPKVVPAEMAPNAVIAMDGISDCQKVG